ncbi:PREDICTED: uncharacterized protein LOC101295739 [Fragaria vesca subsp. vesca]
MSNRLRSAISATLLHGGAPAPPAAERRELKDAMTKSIPSFQSLLDYEPPSDSGDRAELEGIEIPDGFDEDLALEMSHRLHLNVSDCMRFIRSAYQEWASIGGSPQDIIKHAERLWFKERRDLLENLYTILRIQVLGPVEPEIRSDIANFLESILRSGLRQRILSLLKDVNREEPAELVGPHSEPRVLDSSGILVQQEDVLSLEKLILGHCLCLSTLVVDSPQADIKEILLSLIDCVSYLHHTTRQQVAFSLLFSIVIPFVADSPSPSTLEDSFKNEFLETVMATGRDQNVEGFLGCIRLAWAAHMIVTQDLDHLDSCLELVFMNNVFQFISDEILYQNHDDDDMSYIYNIYFDKLIRCLVSDPTFLLKNNPEMLSGNDVLWTFVNEIGEGSLNVHTRVSFLNMLSSLASSEESTSIVLQLLRWSDEFEKFFADLSSYHARSLQLSEVEAKVLASYLNILQKVVEHGNFLELNSFDYVEPLFKLLLSDVPPFVKGALFGAIKAFVHVSPVLKDKIWEKLEEYVKSGYMLGVHDMQFELQEVEVMIQSYPSTISFLDLLNALLLEERDLDCMKKRAYTDLSEKWQLVVACLRHFQMILSLYDISEDNVSSYLVSSQHSTVIPMLDFLEDFTNGNTVFQNIMLILSPGVNVLISERTNQVYGKLLEKAVQLSMEIIVLVLQNDLLADYQLLDDNISQPAPNITHFLLHFDLESSTGQIVFEPKFPHSCLKVILETLEKLSKLNMSLHESGFKLLYKLCSDAKTRNPMMKLLRGKEYLFFVKHLCVCPCPEDSLCISSRQVASMINNLAVELYAGDVSRSTDLEACRSILEICLGMQILKMPGVRIVAAALTTYPACDSQMRKRLRQVALICMIKLRDERFLFPDGDLLKRILSIVEQESSESFRLWKYRLLLSFFQCCQHALDPDIEIDRGPDREFAFASFSVLRKEARSILDLVIVDANAGSEKMKTVALYVLDALVLVDDEKYCLQRLQTAGFLRDCIESLSRQEVDYSRELEAKLALFLRISHTYGTSRAELLFSMGILQHCGSCRVADITAMLRLVFSLLVLIDKYDVLEVEHHIVREVALFIQKHSTMFDDLLWGEGDAEPRELARSIVSRVWRIDSAFPCRDVDSPRLDSVAPHKEVVAVARCSSWVYYRLLQ